MVILYCLMSHFAALCNCNVLKSKFLEKYVQCSPKLNTSAGALVGASGLLVISVLKNSGPISFNTRKTHPKWADGGDRRQYCINHSNLTDSSELQELRALTSQHERGVMESTPDVGQFLILVMRMLKAKNIIEVGSFTGRYCIYSLLMIHF